jgi:hypothetical protein
MAGIRMVPPWKGIVAGVAGVAAGGYLTWVFRADGSYLIGSPLGVLGGAAAALIAYLPLALFFGRLEDERPAGEPQPDAPPG